MNMKLNKVSKEKWIHNIVVFLAPVGIIYLTTAAELLAQEGHVFSVKDLIPSTFAQGGIALYILNSALDYLRKIRT